MIMMTLIERRMRDDLIETFKIINGISNYGRHLVIQEMVNFSNTINYLAAQMNNKTSFKQHNKEMFIIVAGVKEWERKYPFCVADQYVGPWFVGSVCKASSSMFFSDGFQVESVAVMWERSVCAVVSWFSDHRHTKRRD